MMNSECDVDFKIDNRSNINTFLALFARGVRTECGKLTRTMPLVKLQGK